MPPPFNGGAHGGWAPPGLSQQTPTAASSTGGYVWQWPATSATTTINVTYSGYIGGWHTFNSVTGWNTVNSYPDHPATVPFDHRGTGLPPRAGAMPRRIWRDEPINESATVRRRRQLREERARRQLVAEAEQRDLERAERAAAEIRQRDAASEAATALLRRVIGEEEFRRYREHSDLLVPSSVNENIRYRIRQGCEIEIQQRDTTASEEVWHWRGDTLCIHPNTHYPEGDELATLYIIAKHDERELWRVANHHTRAGGGARVA